MPTIAWNRDQWDRNYAWDDAGDEWSRPWGGTDAQWSTCLYPRLIRILPTSSVLEIAPGYGRWTNYLLPNCRSYIGVDLSERCVAACQERFADRADARFFVNDGSTLPMVDDHSIELVFSFDSLVHAEEDVIAGYLNEVRRVLRSDGVAFIHHSNMGQYRSIKSLWKLATKLDGSIPLIEPMLARSGLANCRGWSMTAHRFAELAEQAGLSCIGQEVINWTGSLMTDCISLVTIPGSKWDRPNVLARNRHFVRAVRASATAARVFLPADRGNPRGQ
jgi:SAM-dependent methyltransferase